MKQPRATKKLTPYALRDIRGKSQPNQTYGRTVVSKLELFVRGDENSTDRWESVDLTSVALSRTGNAMLKITTFSYQDFKINNSVNSQYF